MCNVDRNHTSVSCLLKPDPWWRGRARLSSAEHWGEAEMKQTIIFNPYSAGEYRWTGWSSWTMQSIGASSRCLYLLRNTKITLQYCRVPKNGLPKNGQAGISSKNKNYPRLEKWVKSDFTTRKQLLLWTNSFCCEDDFYYVIADFETTPLRRFEIFQPHSPSVMRRRVPCARYKLTYVTRSRIEK